MWNRIIYTLIAISILVSAFGQRVSSKAPDIGSKVSYVSYEEDNYLDLESNGDDSVWDYSYFKSPYQREYSVEKPRSGQYHSIFPNAEFVVKEANDREVYYRFSGNNLLELGRSGGFWYMENLQNAFKYSTNPIVRKSGMTVRQRYSDRSAFTATLGINELFQFGNIQVPLSTDSVRYDVSITREVSADGKGQLILPQSIFDVIRVKQEIELVVNVFTKGSFGWQEVGTIVSQDGSNSDLFQGTFHLEIFEFWSEDHAFPVLTVERDEQDVNHVKYLVNDSNIPSIKVYGGKKDVIAFPNPTYGDIEFQLVNLLPGSYTLQIYNIVSKPLYTSTYKVTRSRKIKTDLSFLSKGTYLYSIIDPQGNKIVTKRVMIITP